MNDILLDRVTRSAPVRLRFRDEAAGKFITDGLRVSACDPAVPFRTVQAFTNTSGDYILAGLPGLAQFEQSDGGPEAFSNAAAKKKTYLVEVIDSFRRYIPIRFSIPAPIAMEDGLPQHRGLFFWEDPADSFTGKTPYVPLYPAPSCPVSPSLGIIRATLCETPISSQPRGAAGALLVAAIHGQNESTVRGIADKKGNIVVMFPYPEPVIALSESMPQPDGPSWTAEIAVFYKRKSTPPDVFDLQETLSQPVAALAIDAGVVIRFNEDLILKTTGQSVLYITPAA